MITPAKVSRKARTTQPNKTGWSALARSAWLWVALVVSLVTSPMLFLTWLVLGALLTVGGIWIWTGRHRIATVAVAVGVGLLVGALPYSLAALRVLVER